MSDKNKQLETVLDQFDLKHLHSYGHTFSDSRNRAAFAVQWSSPYETKSAVALPGCCEFATGIILANSENRTCNAADRVFCPATDFKNPKIVQGCIIRKEKLASEQT